VKACARKRRGLVGVLAHPSLRFIIDPRENPATTRQIVQGFIAAGATHLVLAPRTLNEGIAHWMSKEIIQPVREAAGENVPGGELQER